MTDADGADLLHRAAAGDRDAFDRFVRRWERPLGRFLVRVTGSAADADDARQTTFVRALCGAATFRGGQVSTWLFRTALRVAIDQRRSAAVRAAGPLDGADDLEDRGASPPARAAEADDRAALRAALGRLEPRDRALVWLRAAEGQTFAAVAEALGLPESTARLRYVRALARLRRELHAKAVT